MMISETQIPITLNTLILNFIETGRFGSQSHLSYSKNIKFSDKQEFEKNEFLESEKKPFRGNQWLELNPKTNCFSMLDSMVHQSLNGQNFDENIWIDSENTLDANAPEFHKQLYYLTLIPRYVRQNIYSKALLISRGIFGGSGRTFDQILSDLKSRTLYFDNFMSSAQKPANSTQIDFFWQIFDNLSGKGEDEDQEGNFSILGTNF